MSITNLEVIEYALREINVIAEGDSASPEQGTQCLKKLNAMMELLREKDIDWGWYEQSATTGTCPIPDYAELAVWKMLAINIAPQYGASVSQELVAVASDAWKTVHRKAIAESLDNTDMSHMPVGSGYWGNRYDINTDS